MVWICPNCSSSNDDEQTQCFVCGMDRPLTLDEPEADDCKIVFSGFEAFKDSINRFFRRKSRKAALSKSRTEESYASSERTEDEEELSEGVWDGTDAAASEADFAEPWPEHKIRFDV